MLQSMTGFGSKEARLSPWGKVCVELRSTNHKFLDISFRLPEGLLALEEGMKKEIEAMIKRGRVTCAINLVGQSAPSVLINQQLLKNYLAALQSIKRRTRLKDAVRLETLIHLPGVLSVTESKISKEQLWPQLKKLLAAAVENLARSRAKEGQALAAYLKKQAAALKADLQAISARFKKAVKHKIAAYQTDEERTAFLRNADISEEIARLAFHVRSFQEKINRQGPIGKELDFIAQEMQREANTIAAKSFDAKISGWVVQLKSQIEKIREQAQNIE